MNVFSNCQALKEYFENASVNRAGYGAAFRLHVVVLFYSGVSLHFLAKNCEVVYSRYGIAGPLIESGSPSHGSYLPASQT